ncbi:hypothetical protein [Ktedonobacter racemifer]|uniref:Uncharacterized protein n=1 Tax=Ktedonobacter racemifer DSM 44963 TaxID=485913 RepID=D6TE49_KTERA|nr:hypothetical protein [Ktedonobacter racemifer]EFH88422.1 hypothetical protein Krac_9882 [Ktedonobacter racemifer DSM 44963]
MRQEKELACDKQATLATRRPLALASALLKVNLYAIENPSPLGMSNVLPSFAEMATLTEQRIDQLYVWRTRLHSQEDLVHWQQEKKLSLPWQISLLFFFVLLGASINVLVFYGLQYAFT